MYDNRVDQIKIGDKVMYAISLPHGRTTLHEGTVFAESIMQPGAWIVIRKDRAMVGPIYPREMLKI